MSIEPIKKAQVHRFRNFVAIYLGDGETVYLNHSQAVALSIVLEEAAIDINKNEFQHSEFITFNMEEALS